MSNDKRYPSAAQIINSDPKLKAQAEKVREALRRIEQGK